MNISAQGSFTGLTVAGAQTSGTFGITFRPHPIADFITNATPGAFAISTRDLGDSRFLTLDAEDDFQARDTDNNRIVDNIAVTVEHRLNRSTAGDGTVVTSHAHVNLLGTNASNEIVAGTGIIVEIGQPGVSADNSSFFLSSLTPTIEENTTTPISLKFRKINNVPISLVLNPNERPRDGDLFTVTNDPDCATANTDSCFFSHRVSLLISKILGTKVTKMNSSYSYVFSARKVGKSSSSGPLSSMLVLRVVI